MQHAVAPVKNVVHLAHLYEEVAARAIGVPGIALVHGETGLGKTTAVQHLAAKTSAVWVRAIATWTPRTMLRRIAKELGGGTELSSSADLVEWIAEKLRDTGRPVFIDEGDSLTSSKQLVETFRDLHDLSNVPFIVIGMKDFQKEIRKRPQLEGRISQWIEFKALDLADTRTMANKLVTDVEISDDLIEYVHRTTRGSARGLVVALSRIESQSRGRWTKVTRDLWGDRDLTLATAA